MSVHTDRISQICSYVEACPVCGSRNRVDDVEHKKNRYSEEIAALLDMDEDELLQSIRCVRCQDCDLGYKDWWFKPDFYYRVFVEAAPTHPHGWDAVSGAFTPKAFEEAVRTLMGVVRRDERHQIGRYRRTVQSYFTNVPQATWRKHPEAQQLVRDTDLNRLSAPEGATLLAAVTPLITEPRKFGRFAAFANDDLEQMVRRNVTGVTSYGELGCPLWGMFRLFAADPAVTTVFLQDEDKAFWGPTCCNAKGENCSAYASRVWGVDQITNMTALVESGARLDVLAIINYLDHLALPLRRLEVAASIADNLLIVLNKDRPELQGYIQHNTSFNDRVFQKMTDMLGMTIVERISCGEEADEEFFAILMAKPARH
jgi:hypothetical protein